MHACRRILFICTVKSLYYMRVYHRCFFNTSIVCVVGDCKWSLFSPCSLLALVTGVGGYILTGVEIRDLSYIFLYFCGC